MLKIKDNLTFEQKNKIHRDKMQEYDQNISNLKIAISKFEELRREEELKLTDWNGK